MGNDSALNLVGSTQPKREHLQRIQNIIGAYEFRVRCNDLAESALREIPATKLWVRNQEQTEYYPISEKEKWDLIELRECVSLEKWFKLDNGLKFQVRDILIEAYELGLSLRADSVAASRFFRANSDFTEVVFKNLPKISLTPSQGKALKIIYGEYKEKKAGIAKVTVMERINVNSKFKDLFRSNKTAREKLFKEYDKNNRMVRLNV